MMYRSLGLLCDSTSLTVKVFDMVRDGESLYGRRDSKDGYEKKKKKAEMER